MGPPSPITRHPFTPHQLLTGRPWTAQVDAGLPSPPGGKKWCRVVDTNLPSPKDFTPGGNAGVDAVYGVEAFSSIMLIAK